MTKPLPQSSSSLSPELLGRVLKVKRDLSALSQVVLDNGTTGTITIATRPDQLEGLLASDLAAIHEHLMTRKPGRFRVKHKQ
jgi:hypothetical protein